MARAFFSIANLEHLRDAYTEYYFSFLDVIAFFIIIECTDLNDKIVTDQQKNIAIEVIHRSIEISVNCKETKYWKIGREDAEKRTPMSLQVKGFLIGFLASLLNHSCAPNVEITGENVNLISVIYPIKTGDQLFISYGPLHFCEQLNERKAELKKSFHFDCKCVACTENYQTKEELPKAGIDTDNLINQVLPSLLNYNFNNPTHTVKRKEDFKIVNNYIKQHFNLYPCEELASLVELQMAFKDQLYHYRLLTTREYDDEHDGPYHLTVEPI